MGDRRRPGGPATENAGAGTPASGGPAIPAPRSGTNEAVRGGPGPGRNAQQTGSSDRQQNGEASNVSASNSPSRDSDRQQNGNASSSSKKRKRISARSYFKKFKMAQGGDAADVGVASDDKENTSSGHVADSNIYKLCEETVVKQGSEPSSEVAKSGQLDQDFGQRIALPDSKFVMEEFIHFKEQDEPISIQPMENEPVETSVGSRGGLASEAVDFSENIISCNSDDIGVESADSIGQKALLLIECNQEIEKIKKKYASLLQKEESTYVQALRDLTDIYRKGLVEKSLADNFQGQITPPAAPQGSPVMEHASEPSSAAEPSSIWNAQPQSILAGHLYGMTSSPLVPAPAPNGSEGSAGAQLHASAPLLQHLRMPWAHAVHTDQQQLPPASPPLGQYAPVIMGSYASTVPWGGNANMSAALRHAATRLGGGPLRAEQRQLVSSVVAKVSRPVTEAEHDHVCNQIKQIEEKKEELYIMIADLTRSYKVPRKIAHRNAMVMDQLAPQVQPRPNDQIWVASRRAQRLDYFLTHVGWWTLGAGTAHGLRWTFDQIDPDINKSIAVEMHKLREKMEKMMR
ncbi:hypothetical protein ACQ4PT_039247 [Festuca glaucescens]